MELLLKLRQIFVKSTLKKLTLTTLVAAAVGHWRKCSGIGSLRSVHLNE
jgi:hypothetical protein